MSIPRMLALATVLIICPAWSYHLPGAEEPLPSGYEPIVPGQEDSIGVPSVGVPVIVDPNVPQDTPEVARAKAAHFAAVRQAAARAAVPLTLSAPSPSPFPSYSPLPAYSSGYSLSSIPAWATQNTQQVTDTFEVAAEKAKHLAAVEEAKRRLVTPVGVPIVHASLPAPVQDTPEVAAARAEHLAAVAAAEARDRDEISGTSSSGTQTAPVRPNSQQILTKVHASHFADAGYRPLGRQYQNLDEVYYSNPAPAVKLTSASQRYPGAIAVPAYTTSSATYTPQYVNQQVYVSNDLEDDGQYRGNDEASSGEYSYSYNDGLSSKTESRSSDGITRGSYSYLDANGVLQTVSYEADDVNGFRVYGSNVPQVSPAVAAALGNPEDPSAAIAAASTGAIKDTPEVETAKQAHFAAYREALQRLQAESH